ncbi:type IV secretion system protein VirB10 [Caballeronia sp. SBC2]|nr:type IV secretion system protein VirB10 [Caballeronia sp. SBC2]QIE29043.1 Bacterial conjugation TrbI-like protein [Caballeronia sp. SBC2]
MNGIESGSGHEGKGNDGEGNGSGMSSISNEAGATDIAGDRGMPNLKQTRKKANVNKLTAVAIAVIALATVALGGALFAKRLQDQHNQAKADARTAPKEMGADTGHDFSVDADRLKREKAAAAEQASISAAQSGASMPVPSGAPASAVAVAGVGGHTGAAAQTAPHIETVAERRFDGDVLLNNGDDKGDGAPNGTRNSDGKGASLVPVIARGVAGGLDDRLTPSALPSVKASFLPDLDYLLKRGIIIPCAQKTKIVTTYSGMTSCIVTQDVYSADGRTLLVERGSEATGEQRTALMQGQARIFVLWSRIDMPNGVTIPLDSPGSDSLGASGLEAYVDNHFWDRFGGAIMVSLIGDFGQAASNRSLGSGNNQIQFSNTSSAGQSLADDTLKNTVDIPPTAYSNQGSALNIFVARDVDFRSVYDLEHQQ